jgi:hypothetical protein
VKPLVEGRFKRTHDSPCGLDVNRRSAGDRSGGKLIVDAASVVEEIHVFHSGE